MSSRSQLTAERRREERVKGRSHPARVSWEMRWVLMSFSAHKPGDRNPPGLSCTLRVWLLLLILQISFWIFLLVFVFGIFSYFPLQGWWEDCRLLLCLGVSRARDCLEYVEVCASHRPCFLAVCGLHSRGLYSSVFRELCCNYLLLIQAPHQPPFTVAGGKWIFLGSAWTWPALGIWMDWIILYNTCFSALSAQLGQLVWL